MASKNIIPEAYSALNSITRQPGGPLDGPVAEIAKKMGIKDEQVLLAWAKAKGWVQSHTREVQFSPTLESFRARGQEGRADDAVVGRAIIVTTSSRKERLESYLGVGDIELSEHDIKKIDKAGVKGEKLQNVKMTAKKALPWVGLVAASGYLAWTYMW
jgi:diketogulonate reductase-like aldo/keto reductase